VGERFERRESVTPSGHGLDDARVAHGIERLAVHPKPQRFGHAEADALLAENLDLALEVWRPWGHIAFKCYASEGFLSPAFTAFLRKAR
jgi:hypothetical protein